MARIRRLLLTTVLTLALAVTVIGPPTAAAATTINSIVVITTGSGAVFYAVDLNTTLNGRPPATSSQWTARASSTDRSAGC